MDFSRIGWNYAKDGSRISQSEFQDLRDNHFETYARIGLTHVPGAGSVSTVWLGSDYGYGPAGVPPLQFESIVTYEGYRHDTELARYRTEQEAREGHLRFVQIFKDVVGKKALDRAARASLVRENRGTGFDRGGW